MLFTIAARNDLSHFMVKFVLFTGAFIIMWSSSLSCLSCCSSLCILSNWSFTFLSSLPCSSHRILIRPDPIFCMSCNRTFLFSALFLTCCNFCCHLSNNRVFYFLRFCCQLIVICCFRNKY